MSLPPFVTQPTGFITPDSQAAPTRPLMGYGADKRGRQDDDTSAGAWLAMIVCVAIALRLLVFFMGPSVDVERAELQASQRYMQLGHQWAETGQFGFVEDPDPRLATINAIREKNGQLETAGEGGIRPEVYTLPGYPALLAAMEYFEVPAHALLMTQCVLSILTVLMVYAAAAQLLRSSSLALLAAGIVAVHPAAVAAPNALLTTSLVAALVMIGIWLVSHERMRNVWSGAFAGIAIGFSVLIHPISLLVGAILALWLLLTDRRMASVSAAFMLLVMSFAPAAFWIYRNNEIGFGFRLTSQPTVESFVGAAPLMTIDPDLAENPVTIQIKTLEQQLEEDEDVLEAMNKITTELALNDPGAYARVMFNGAQSFLFAHSLGDLYHLLGIDFNAPDPIEQIRAGHWLPGDADDPATAVVGMVWFGFNALLALASVMALVLLLWRWEWRLFILLGGLALYAFAVSHLGGNEYSRVVFMGVQAMLVASVFMHGPQRAPRKKLKEKAIEHFEKTEPLPPTLPVSPLPRGSNTGSDHGRGLRPI